MIRFYSLEDKAKVKITVTKIKLTDVATERIIQKKK